MFERAKNDRAKESSHMTMFDAAKLAREAECAELWLTHYSPALTDPDEFAGEAVSVFANTVVAHDAHTRTIRFEDEE